MTPSFTFAILVYGCRLNQAEAERFRGALTRWGGVEVPRNEAQVLCLHSCAVTAPAAHEAEKTLRAFRKANPAAKVILSGCAAGLLPTDLSELRVLNPDKDRWEAHALASLIAWGFCAPTVDTVPAGEDLTPRARASLIVEDGCDRFCTYCIVPHLRGAPKSQPMEKLLAQAERLFASGYQEIVLTGCHLALYKDPETGADFLELLKRLCAVRGVGRFRIGSLEPGVLDDKALIRLMASSGGRLCNFLHLPIQSGADPVLKRMGRPYLSADIRRTLDVIGEELSLCGLGADWIVGFPGETEADAEATRQLVADYPFTGAHIFPYSRRPGTPAADYPDQVPEHILHRRVKTLTATAEEVMAATRQRFVGHELIAVPERQREGRWEGWSAEHLRCRFSGEAVRRQLTEVQIETAEEGLLCGVSVAR